MFQVSINLIFDVMSNHSFNHKWQPPQDSRRRIWMQAWRAMMTFLFLFLMAAIVHRAQAQTDYPGGYTLMPLEPGKIALLSMTVDVSFHDDGTTTIAEVQANYRLHNRNKSQARTFKVAIPGYAAPKPAPRNINLQLNGKEVEKTPGNQQWWLAEITLKPNQRANLVMTYAAEVGSGPIAHFRFPLELTGQIWPGRLESARFTISFPDPPNPQSWISLTPETYTLSAESVTWSYDLKDPKQPIDFLFIRPSLWKRIQQERRTAAQSQSPQAHKALGAIYAQLATATQDPAIFERYYPLAVASYSQAQRLAPEDAETYLALAQLYQLRAEMTPKDAPSYTALAVNELAKALENGVNDPTIQEKITQGFASLIARARARGDFDAANAYLERLESIAANNPQLKQSEIIQEEREALAIDWAWRVFEDQGAAPARALLQQTFGSEIVSPGNVRFAQMNSLYIQVKTEAHLRTIDVNAAVRDGDRQIIDDLANALAQTQAANIELLEGDPDLLHINIPFADAQDLVNRQRVLASAIPDQPEWALLRAILSPQTLRWDTIEDRWRTVERYEETISLITVPADAGLQALSLERAANALDPSTSLNQLLQAIWLSEAQLWRNLAINSQARYTLTLYPRPGAPLNQTWTALPGDELMMTGTATQYHLGAMLLAGLALYLLFVALSWLLFKIFA